MGLDFDKLISAPQSNIVMQTKKGVSEQKKAVVMPQNGEKAVMNAQPKQDEFIVASGQQAAPSAFDKFLKYSGLVALVATPIALVASNKINAKNTQKMFDEFSEQMTKSFKGSMDEVNKNTGKILTTVGAMSTAVFAAANVKGAKKNEVKPVEFKPETIEILETEATKRINGDYKWPKIDNVKAWMVTAETQSFLKVGGLAEVAVQLPDAFNKKHDDASEKHMDIITPLYVGNDGAGKVASIEKIDDNHFVYKGAHKNTIDLTKNSSLRVKVYDPNTEKYKNERVDVLSGTLNGTKYVFLRNDKMFSMDPHKDNHSACKGAYVLNKKGVGEVERMVFLSKAVYELMQDAKENKVPTIEAPNVMIANDWHASAISSLMRYEAPVANEQNKMSDETLEYIKETPVIHITHNAQYQGDDWQHADQLFRTLFERNTDEINSVIKGYNEEGFPLAKGYGNYNEALSDLNLADRSIAVSGNYAEELCTANDLGCGLEDVNRVRKQHGTMLGIVNGYTKALSEPNQKMIDSINNDKFLKPLTSLKAYDNVYNDKGYQLKLENKQVMVETLNDMAKRAAAGEKWVGSDGKVKLELYKPEECKIPSDIDVSTVPILANVGRFVEQKGYDYLVESLTAVLKNLQPGEEPPVVALLGSGDAGVAKDLQELKDEIAEINPKAAERIFVFAGFNAPLRDGLGVASDFFLIPSKWEPCGLTQMECMPKGSLPIALSTGGLVDTIEEGQDGFLSDVFYGYKTNEKIYDNGKAGKQAPKNNVEAFTVAVKRALNTFYNNPEHIKEMAINAMAKDFSWNVPGGSLEQYEELMQTGKITQK